MQNFRTGNRLRPQNFQKFSPKIDVNDQQQFRNDVFVAAPMSAYASDDKAYSDNRDRLLNLFSELKSRTKFRHFFCPAVIIDSLHKFDPSEHALVQDVLALEASEVFILFYLPPLPSKPSSVFVEAGMALLARKPSAFIVRSRDDLPYMLRTADQITVDRLRSSWKQPSFPESIPTKSFVKIVETGDDNIIDVDELAKWFNALPLRKRQT